VFQYILQLTTLKKHIYTFVIRCKPSPAFHIITKWFIGVNLDASSFFNGLGVLQKHSSVATSHQCCLVVYCFWFWKRLPLSFPTHQSVIFRTVQIMYT